MPIFRTNFLKTTVKHQFLTKLEGHSTFYSHISLRIKIPLIKKNRVLENEGPDLRCVFRQIFGNKRDGKYQERVHQNWMLTRFLGKMEKTFTQNLCF